MSFTKSALLKVFRFVFIKVLFVRQVKWLRPRRRSLIEFSILFKLITRYDIQVVVKCISRMWFSTILFLTRQCWFHWKRVCFVCFSLNKVICYSELKRRTIIEREIIFNCFENIYLVILFTKIERWSDWFHTIFINIIMLLNWLFDCSKFD